jgi:hypothetical protein
MKKITKIVMSLLLLVVFIPTMVSASSTWFNLGAGWRVRYDTYDSVKGPHLHYYKGDTHYYCMRIDTGKQCESDYNNRFKDKVPNWVKKTAAEQPAIKKAINQYHGSEISRILSILPAWALISIGVLLTFISIVTFFLPCDDVVTVGYWILVFA